MNAPITTVGRVREYVAHNSTIEISFEDERFSPESSRYTKLLDPRLLTVKNIFDGIKVIKNENWSQNKHFVHTMGVIDNIYKNKGLSQITRKDTS